MQDEIVAPPSPGRSRTLRALSILALTTVTVVTTLAPIQPVRASDTSNRWDRFSESSACGDPFTRAPVASKTGALSDSESILGPFGTYFGRSISEIRSQLVTWSVPYSGGSTVRVHEEMLPSLREVADDLRTHAEEGRIYQITSAHAFTPRTIGARYRISRHAMGLAIDINPAENPYRRDAVLITDMPDWFVQVWRDAGFCWGGDWVGSKDPMHFSWMGPAATPATDTLSPLAPNTAKTAFRVPAESHRTEFGPVIDRYSIAIADANSNGAPDVVGLRPHPDGSVLDIALSSLGYGYCSVGRWFVPDASVGDADRMLLADVDGDSGQDLVALDPSNGSLVATVATKRSRYEDLGTTDTGAGADAVAITGADFDGDHRADLWEATPQGDLRIWAGPGFSELLDESPLPAGTPVLIAAGDRDGGDRPELFALYGAGSGSRIDVLTNEGAWIEETEITLGTGVGSVVAIGAGDYDGDGRSDAQVLTVDGELMSFIGNSSTGVPPGRWFLHPDRDCHEPVLLDYAGSFMDDETSIFIGSIESIAASGVTRGCNPPFNDRFCPGDPVSREQMAAFLVRALGLTSDTHGGFEDVAPDSTFARDIGKLATVGITKGCNPPANDRYCPDDTVSREQMAAFLVRALGLTSDTHGGFDDVAPASTFANDVSRLATAGITRGCNPPQNSEYCPKDPVTRGQMAAFLHRAGLGE